MATSPSIFARRILRLLITLAVIGVLASDGLKVAPALSRVSAGLNGATAAALEILRAEPTARERAERAAADAAAARGTQLDAYDQASVDSAGTRHVRIGVTVSTRVTGTILAAPILGLLEGLEPAEWYGEAGVRLALRQSKQIDDIGGAAP
jgi:hypothetical protein